MSTSEPQSITEAEALADADAMTAYSDLVGIFGADAIHDTELIAEGFTLDDFADELRDR